MRLRIARVVSATMYWLCEATGHPGGCWLLDRSPLAPLFGWAINVCFDADVASGARALTERTGKRMAEYLTSMKDVEREILDDLLRQPRAP